MKHNSKIYIREVEKIEVKEDGKIKTKLVIKNYGRFIEEKNK